MAGKTGIAVFVGAAVAGPAAALVWPDVVKWVLVAGYEVILFIVGIAGGVLNDLKKRWQTRVADRLDKALNRRFSRFDRRYREYILSDLRTLDVKGLATSGFYTPNLDDVFVDVGLDYRAPHQVPSGLLDELSATDTSRRSIWDFLARKDPAVLAVLGAPGSGKTTLLRHTARRLFANKRRNVPILLYLRDHVAEIAKEPSVSVATLVTNALGDLGRTEPSGWFTQKLTDGDCVVLLDGLDEVARKQDRQLVADWVERQIKRFPRNDFVITSRPHGYLATPVNGATALRVQSFTDDQVRAFVRGWYLAVERHINQDGPEAADRKAESEAEDLLGRLYDAPALADLTVNPLLLTMIANVHRYRGALPGSRADLYSEICQVMLWRRQEAKKLPTDLSGDKKETLLAALAYTMMQDRVRDLSGKRLHEEVKSTLRRLSRKLTAAEFVADVTSNGLLVERESGLYAFAHHTFQEFLAASHIRDKSLVGTLVDNVDDLWWRETTLLYTARADADAIVGACLESGNVQALSLALDCADQGSELAPELSDELDKLVTDALEITADADHQGLAARVLVTRHLRRMTSVEGHGQICPVPITRKIYHLFRQEVRGPMPDGPGGFKPDDVPVGGVRRADALSFVRWVNTISSAGHDYRLPTAAELGDPTVRRMIATVPSAWLHPDQASYNLWTRTSVHPHGISTAAQVDQVAVDLTRCAGSLTKFALLYTIVLSRQVGKHTVGLEIARVLTDRLTTTRDNDLESALDRSFAEASKGFDEDGMADLVHVLSIARTLDSLTGRQTASEMRRVVANAVNLGPPPNNHSQELDRLLIGVSDPHATIRSLAIPWNRVSVTDLSSIIGPAMVTILTEQVDRRTSSPRRQLGATLEKLAFEGAVDVVLDLDRFPSLVHDACSETNLPPSSWAQAVGRKFAESATSVFTRQQELTAKLASALRITALCLVSDARSHGLTVTADLLLRCYAGLILLEHRATGAAPAQEMILLATT
nr:NACHT domain-containing protein [Kibdelosporangium sp. MJ126-NF4]CEL21995.1 hypothetical protein [Kibdelosporangium sp. MJ126-NF4]CTQ92775.1 hypothetical protein [Kibdelosporangium sp. MJ126-NF4]